MNYPEPPIPPPCRIFKETFWSGFCETEESKRNTREWKKYIANYTPNIPQNGYSINNPYMK